MGAPVSQLPEYTIKVTSWAFGGGEAAATTTASLSTLASVAGPAAMAFIAFDIAMGLICGSFAQAMARYNDYMREWGARDPIALQKYSLEQQINTLEQQMPSIPGAQRQVAQESLARLQTQLDNLTAAQQAAHDIVATSTLAELPIYAPAISDAVAATYLPVAVSGATGAAAVVVPAAGAAASILPAVAKGAALTTMLANAGLAVERALAPLTSKLPIAQQTIQENPGTFMIIVVALIFILISREA